MLTWHHLKSKRSFLQVRHVDRIDGFAVRLRPLVCHALARTIRRQYSQCEGLAGRLCIPCDILEPRSSKSSDVGRADPNNDITIKHTAHCRTGPHECHARGRADKRDCCEKRRRQAHFADIGIPHRKLALCTGRLRPGADNLGRHTEGRDSGREAGKDSHSQGSRGRGMQHPNGRFVLVFPFIAICAACTLEQYRYLGVVSDIEYRVRHCRIVHWMGLGVLGLY
jgi:hypothetical protein